jgi:protein-disulfide isomerase
MSKKPRRSRRKERKTNWLLIGGLAAVGILFLIGLSYLALREPTPLALADYCTQNPERCVTQGAADAPLTMVEVSDFACHNCRDFYEQTAPLLEEEYVATDRLQWVALPYALRAETMPAANAALCANEQDAYFPFAAALFDQFDEPTTLTREGFLATADSLSLDMSEFTACVDEERHVGVVQSNMTAARLAGVSGTPTFFINGRELRGAHPFATFQQTIESLVNS